MASGRASDLEAIIAKPKVTAPIGRETSGVLFEVIPHRINTCTVFLGSDRVITPDCSSNVLYH